MGREWRSWQPGRVEVRGRLLPTEEDDRRWWGGGGGDPGRGEAAGRRVGAGGAD